MENVNDRDNQESSFRDPLNSFKHRQVFNGVEYKIPHVSSEGSLTKNPYVPNDCVPVDSETWNCDNDSELCTLYKAALRTLSKMKPGEKWGNSVRLKPDSFWIDKFNEIGFTFEETENGEWFKIYRDWEKYPYAPEWPVPTVPTVPPDTSSSEWIEKAKEVEDLETKVRSFLTDSGYDETQINQMLGISLVRSTCIKKYLYSVQKRELPFIAPDTSSSEWIEHPPEYKQLLTESEPPAPEWPVPQLPDESNRPQTDKQKMKEIKLAALESSKSLTRLLELLREYDA